MRTAHGSLTLVAPRAPRGQNLLYGAPVARFVPLSEAKPPGYHPPARLARRSKRSDAERPRLPNFINLCGDYRFLRAGYWALIDSELNEVASTPTPMQAITAQNAAACLLEAGRAGIPCVEWKVVRRPEDIEPPSVLVPVAGLTESSYEVRTRRSAQSQFRRASQNATRSVIAARLPGPLKSMKMVVGLTTNDNFRLAWDVWRTFGVPLAQIWYIETQDQDGAENDLFLGLDPLPLHDLTDRELLLLEEVSQRPMSQS
jgi:hypothetical protein